MIALVNYVLLALLAATAVRVLFERSLLAAVMLAGMYSLLSAAWFTLQDAVDVAFTEAAVGAGISTILMLGTLALTQRNEKTPTQGHPVIGLFVCLLTGAALLYASTDMPLWGDPNAPIHRHPVYREYVYDSLEKFEIPNVVTSVLAGYRGYDTLGETTVILTAGIAVILLLRRPKEGRT